MAYMSQEKKAKLAPAIKAVCKKFGVKASLAIRHHSTLVLNIKSGPIDFIGNFNDYNTERAAREGRDFYPANGSLQVNVYHTDTIFSGKARKFFSEVLAAMMDGNHDNSDIMTDYFDVGWYVDINVGRWNKDYELTK